MQGGWRLRRASRRRISDEGYTAGMEWRGLKEHISAKAAWMERFRGVELQKQEALRRKIVPDAGTG